MTEQEWAQVEQEVKEGIIFFEDQKQTGKSKISSNRKVFDYSDN